MSDRVTGLLHDAVGSSASSAAARDGLSLQHRSDVSLNVWRQQLEQLDTAVQIAGARCVLCTFNPIVTAFRHRMTRRPFGLQWASAVASPVGPVSPALSHIFTCFSLVSNHTLGTGKR